MFRKSTRQEASAPRYQPYLSRRTWRDHLQEWAHERWPWLYGTGMVLVIALVMARGFLTDPEAAVRALRVQGFANVEITSQTVWFVSMRGCGREDAARYDAVATNARGERVEVYVCVGWPFKGATVRSS